MSADSAVHREIKRILKSMIDNLRTQGALTQVQADAAKAAVDAA